MTGENVEEAFLKCSRTILSKIDAGNAFFCGFFFFVSCASNVSKLLLTLKACFHLDAISALAQKACVSILTYKMKFTMYNGSC